MVSFGPTPFLHKAIIAPVVRATAMVYFVHRITRPTSTAPTAVIVVAKCGCDSIAHVRYYARYHWPEVPQSPLAAAFSHLHRDQLISRLWTVSRGLSGDGKRRKTDNIESQKHYGKPANSQRTGLHGDRNQSVTNYPSKSSPFLRKANGVWVHAKKEGNSWNGIPQLKTICKSCSAC